MNEVIASVINVWETVVPNHRNLPCSPIHLYTMELLLFRGNRFIDSIPVNREMLRLGGYIGELISQLNSRNVDSVGEAALGCDYYVGQREEIEQLRDLPQNVMV